MLHLASSRRRTIESIVCGSCVVSLSILKPCLRDLHAARSINELSGIAKSKFRDVGEVNTHTCNMIIPSNIAKCQKTRAHFAAHFAVCSLVTRHVSEHRRCERNLLPLLVDTDTYTIVFEQNHCCRTRGDVILRVAPGMGKDLPLFSPRTSICMHRFNSYVGGELLLALRVPRFFFLGLKF